MRHRHSVTENPGQVVGIAAFAALIGAAAAMLFTPRNGSQVRSGLKRRAAHLKDEVQDHVQGVGDEAADVTEAAKERLQSTASKVAKDAKSTAAKVKDDSVNTKEEAKQAASKPPKSSA